MGQYPDTKWIAVWETDRGCPFTCSFCDWGSATASKVNFWSLERAYREMDWFCDHEIEFMFLANANFGIKARDVDIARYCAEKKAKTGYPKAITVSNTKNAQERSFEVQTIFASSGLNTGGTVSMQSLDQGTLKAIKRDNIKLDGPRGFQELQRRFKTVGMQAYTDLILCLPGETYETFTHGVNKLIENGQHDRILFYNLTILPNAEMGDPAYQERYKMETVTSKIINIHGRKSEDEWDIPEEQRLVVATSTMSREDWVRTRVFAWTTQFLHFDKVMQIPLVIMHELAGLSYRELIELFSEGRFGNANDFPTLTFVREFFIAKAKNIQSGGAEFCHSMKWLDIWWPTDEYVFMELVTIDKIHDFYSEASRMFAGILERAGRAEFVGAIQDAFRLNEAMLKMPFQEANRLVPLSYNVWEFYRAVVGGDAIPLEKIDSVFEVDCSTEQWHSWEEWYRQVVWYSSKRGAYLYDGKTSTELLAGHF